jgi:membrane protein DedA with SNARE-associated domain
MDVFLSQVYCIANDPVSLFWLLFFSSLGNNIFPPIPIEFGTVFAGYLASKGHGTLPVIIAGTASGMILGSLLLFAAAPSTDRRS